MEVPEHFDNCLKIFYANMREFEERKSHSRSKEKKKDKSKEKSKEKSKSQLSPKDVSANKTSGLSRKKDIFGLYYV